MNRLMVLDLNQVVFSTIFATFSKKIISNDLEPDLLRHLILNVIRSNNLKFRHEYNELIIVNDAKTYWRREVFPFYKASRKKSRAESPIDWNVVFTFLDEFKSDLKAFFPYKFIEADGAEADDVIASIVKNADYDALLIISGDKDFVQLHNDKVRQYDPIRKKFVSVKDIEAYLRDHIISGDAGDGVPNIASDDNCFVTGRRQSKVTKKIRESIENGTANATILRNYHRNKQLIDLDCIPEKITNDVINKYQKTEPIKGRLMNYFMKHKLKDLTEKLNDF